MLYVSASGTMKWYYYFCELIELEVISKEISAAIDNIIKLLSLMRHIVPKSIPNFRVTICTHTSNDGDGDDGSGSSIE